MSQSSDQQDTQVFMWIAILVIVLFIIPSIYGTNRESVNGILLELAKLELKPFVVFYEEAHVALVKINQADPANLSWEQMQKILRYSGTWLRWICFPLLILLGTISLFMGRIGKLSRTFNMQKLLENNAETFACLRPIVGKGSFLLSSKSYDDGLWRIALSPVQFAVENGLLLNEKGRAFSSKDILRNGLLYTNAKGYGQTFFDEKKASKTLIKQLGKAFKGYENLSNHRKALATAFVAYAANDKKVCMEILDTLSNSYSEQDGRAICPITEQASFQCKLAEIIEKHKHILKEKLLQNHASFELVWFMALITLARKKGVLASSQFIWLRPLDRPLWYALNQCGGRVAWAEAFSAWTHYMAEKKAEKSLRKPNMEQAVLKFKETLAQTGILAKDSSEILSSGAKVQGDLIFAEAENDPEYDANVDLELTNELY